MELETGYEYECIEVISNYWFQWANRFSADKMKKNISLIWNNMWNTIWNMGIDNVDRVPNIIFWTFEFLKIHVIEHRLWFGLSYDEWYYVEISICLMCIIKHYYALSTLNDEQWMSDEWRVTKFISYEIR